MNNKNNGGKFSNYNYNEVSDNKNSPKNLVYLEQNIDETTTNSFFNYFKLNNKICDSKLRKCLIILVYIALILGCLYLISLLLNIIFPLDFGVKKPFEVKPIYKKMTCELKYD